MSEIPKQYKACVYDQPGKISTKIEILETPEPGQGEVLINLYVSIAPQYSRTSDRYRYQIALEGLIRAFAILIWASWRIQ